MIPHQNCEIFASVVFFIIVKILCSVIAGRRLSMYSKRKPTLTSIPERNENEEEITRKWVPKNKHEVLKAKYKCLKKLFQIYDASVIGILPEPYHSEEETTKRKKRSHRTKTDAYTGTSELSSGDVSRSDADDGSVATAVIRDLKMTQYSSTHVESKSVIAKSDKFATSVDKLTIDKGCECRAQEYHPMPYLEVNEKRKPTRFQSFMQRLFGLRRDRAYNSYTMPNGHVYAASDNNILNYGERRRRRGLRFRRLRRPKKIQSDGALDVKSPVILTYVQSIQRNCLMDTTPRHCPILGCRMISYGIINYNDHLNLCHFTDRKHICHYCHEGFESEYDKFLHENEHIGISKLSTSICSPSRQSHKRASDTQTDPELTKCDIPEEKLKKIVSFFDKIADPDKIVSEIKNIRYSESNLQSQQSKTETADTSTGSDSDKRTISCVNLPRKIEKSKFASSTPSDGTSNHPYETPITCHYCGEIFNYRRQLSLHVDLEHRIHDKFSKFHSCAGIINERHSKRTDMISEDGKINVQSTGKVSGIRRANTPSSLSAYSVTQVKSEESLSCDQSTNIAYYTSLESLKKPSLVNNVLQKVKGSINYKWEPGTKIVRV
ncbi:hypothetical protein O3G_MSEX011204 [Manduca sexta]|uniref:C2H2-type domain-containing protein n=1 Tax=Manduca sexta TaxID=7130 RepID=A0A921ZJP6_MANSE|nr:hypothetical protein O3G_MSEX011204 [Manduca sexta]